ncbi:hypothetical protein [Planomicrobium okeanokoites]|uniref:hypothetical protein n=1 Tax=Planomicrobium okeanokoites TaxID=244 RepID=UPI00356837AC
MAEKNNNDAQEKGFNSTAAYGDPKENTQHKPNGPGGRTEKDSPFHMDADGNLSTGDGETDNRIVNEQRPEELGAANRNATDADEAGRKTVNVRKSESVMDDLSSIDVSDEGLPANDQAESDVPPADPAINDVPDADRSMSDSTEHLSQSAADRTRRSDDNGRE